MWIAGWPLLALILAAGAGAVLYVAVLRFRALRREGRAVLTEATRRVARARAQNGLAANIDMLHSLLHALGPPQFVDGALYFGTTCMRGSTEIVDAVRARFGGAATIFERDVRISTNVQAEDGSRAHNTKLASGPAYDRVLREGKSYRGDTMILGKPYLAVYEPLIADGDVVGILFAGVEDRDEGPPDAADQTLSRTLGALRGVVAAQAQAMEEAYSARQEFDDVRRRAQADQHTAMRAQSAAVAALNAGLQALAAGDLTRELRAALSADYEMLRRNFNDAVSGLRGLMLSVQRNMQSVDKGTIEISGAAGQVARRTESQAGALEESAAQLDRLTKTVRETAGAAGNAAARIIAMQAAVGGADEMLQQTVSAMGRIDRESQDIVVLSGLIDDISLQTNLLALNAGIEAARAGDAGAGFAVIAGEVRALAMRAAEAARSVKELSANSSALIAAGMALVSDTAAALAALNAEFGQLTETVGRIAQAAAGQAAGLAEINGAVGHMERTTQQNLQMVEQTTQAASQLASEAAGVVSALGRFRLAGPVRETVRID
jgi:methyl-accepting chemotaxis protein